MDKPEWAKALIVAELEHDDCDLMTDYFNTKTSRVVALAWSSHNKDLFAEMRKAAATFPETQHLGPGFDVWTARVVLTVPDPGYFVSNGIMLHDGDRDHSPEHEAKTFTTETAARAYADSCGPLVPCQYGDTLVHYRWHITRESIEHREKYSMGHGYYLKGSGRYSSGWIVRKYRDYRGDGTFGGRAGDAMELGPGLMTAREKAAPDAPRVSGVTVRPGTKDGYTEVLFPEKPDTEVLTELKASGFRWSRFGSCWYGRTEALPARYQTA